MVQVVLNATMQDKDQELQLQQIYLQMDMSQTKSTQLQQISKEAMASMVSK